MQRGWTALPSPAKGLDAQTPSSGGLIARHAASRLQLRQPLPVFEDLAPEVALLCQPPRHCLNCEVANLEAARDLLPSHWRRDTRARLGAHRVDRRRRFAARVLLPIYINLILLAFGN